MRTTEAGLDLIRNAESCRLEPYQDIGGRWTIGFGHLMRDSDPRQPITPAQADVLFVRDVTAAETTLNGMVSVTLNDNRYSAIVSWIFNLGGGNFRDSTLRKYVNASKWMLAADEFPRWVHVHGVVVPGLVKRRMAERALFLRPVIAVDNGPVILPAAAPPPPPPAPDPDLA